VNAIFLGIDPGLSGAIALVNGYGELVAVEDMPIAARGGGRVKHEVDAAGITHMLRPHVSDIAHGIVERVGAMPGHGVAGVFSFGHSFGVATAVLACFGIGFEPLCWPQRDADGPLPR
jgi:crossover junction endodeoxyribonuclease RuvC